MTLDKFFEIVFNNEVLNEVYIVKLKYKYEWETEYRYSNEVGFFDVEEWTWVWYDDWCEGETDVEVVAYVPIDEILFPDRKE